MRAQSRINVTDTYFGTDPTFNSKEKKEAAFERCLPSSDHIVKNLAMLIKYKSGHFYCYVLLPTCSLLAMKCFLRRSYENNIHTVRCHSRHTANCCFCYINVLNLKCSKSYSMLFSGGTDLQWNKLLFTCFAWLASLALNYLLLALQIQKCCVGAWFGLRTKAGHQNLHKGRNSCKTVRLKCISLKQYLEIGIFKQSDLYI